MEEQLSTNISIINKTDLDVPLSQDLAAHIVKKISKNENSIFSFLEVVYVEEAEITQINQKHLNHDYVTDIITFGYNEPDQKEPIEATLFCCAPRILEQAKEFQVDAFSEFLRVFIHGLLHLVGYGDHSADQKKVMREKERFYLNYITESYAN